MIPCLNFSASTTAFRLKAVVDALSEKSATPSNEEMQI